MNLRSYHFLVKYDMKRSLLVISVVWHLSFFSLGTCVVHSLFPSLLFYFLFMS